jgi:hypothetical protein
MYMKKQLMLMAILTTLAPAAMAAPKPILFQRYLTDSHSGDKHACVVFTDGTAKVSDNMVYEDAENVPVVFTTKNVRSAKYLSVLGDMVKAGLAAKASNGSFQLVPAKIGAYFASAESVKISTKQLDPQKARLPGAAEFLGAPVLGARSYVGMHPSTGKYVELERVGTVRPQGSKKFVTKRFYRDGTQALVKMIDLACLAAANPAR